MQRARQTTFSAQLSRLTAQPWLWGAMLVLLVAIVYWPAIDGVFVSDDEDYVQNNLVLRSLQGLADIWFKFGSVNQYHPLVWSSFWVEYQLWGLDPRGYHIVNLLLHAACVVLVWRLLVRLALPGAWLAAAIFAVHPVHVESVAWVSERKNLLSCFLALNSLLAYLRFSPAECPGATDAKVPTAQGDWRYYVLAFVLYVAALLAKTVTASVPAVLLVIYWWKRGRITWRDAACVAPFFAVGLALGCVTVWMETTFGGARGEYWELSPIERVLIAGRALWFYAGKLVWPHPLVFFYPRWVIDAHAWWQYLFPLGVVAVLVGLWFSRIRLGRGPLAAVLIFAGVLTPALGFFNAYGFRYTFVTDHYQYHASIAAFALAAAAAMFVRDRPASRGRKFAPLVAAGLLLLLGARAQHRTNIYLDEIAFDADIVAGNPEFWVAHHHLGDLLGWARRYDEAIPHFRKAIEIFEKLIREYPAETEFQNGLASCYLDLDWVQRETRRPDEAEASCRKSIEIREKLVRDHPTQSEFQDGLAWGHVRCGFAQQMAGRPAEAAASQRKAIEIREKLAHDNPTIGTYQNNVATSYVYLASLEREIGRRGEVESALHEAIKIREKLVRDYPTVAEHRADLAANYVDLAFEQQKAGRPADAVASCRKAIEIREKLIQDDGLLTLARRWGTLVTRENLAQNNAAVSKYQDDIAANYVDLGTVERQMGRRVEAESAFRKAIAIREELVRGHPTMSSYKDGLAWCYSHCAAVQQTAGRPADAAASYRKAIEIREKLVQDNPSRADYQHELAISYRDLENVRRGAPSAP